MSYSRRYTHPFKALAGGVVCAGCLLAGVAQADVMFIGGPDSGGSSAYYQNYAFGTALSSFGGFTPDMGQGTIYSSNIAYSPLNLNSSFSVNGANINTTASTAQGGFFTARNAASLDVTNTADDNGYYAIGASGSRTSVQFFTAEALA
ncbi:MAG: hypothetical protein R3E50_17680, partial [Halioglobus sp.]